MRDLTFRSKRQVTLAPGRDVLSDPVPMRTAALTDLLVSLYVPGPTGLVTGHPFAAQDSALFDNVAAEETRTAVNKWIMTSHAFDGVIDFARALAGTGNPQALKPAFDSGDHSHPDDAGYQAMANAIDLTMLVADS
jgi:lysophospholipase L1-like esterase